jgi:hypothetical protein
VDVQASVSLYKCAVNIDLGPFKRRKNFRHAEQNSVLFVAMPHRPHCFRVEGNSFWLIAIVGGFCSAAFLVR